MWKKWQNFTSSISFSFVTRLFQRRHYDRFDGNAFFEEDRIYMRDEENNTILREPRFSITTQESDCSDDDGDDNDDEIVRDWDEADMGMLRPRNHVQDRRDGNKPVCGESIVDDSHNHCGFNKGDERTKLKPYQSRTKFTNRPSSPTQAVKHEVQDLVHSYTQRQYNRLDDGDDFSEICELKADDNDRSRDSENTVFHSIKDGMPNYNKRTKTKRRKKVAKQARRTIRGTWKWIRRGLAGYATDLNNCSLFNVQSGTLHAMSHVWSRNTD